MVIYLCLKIYFPIDHHCTTSSMKQNCVFFPHGDLEWNHFISHRPANLLGRHTAQLKCSLLFLVGGRGGGGWLNKPLFFWNSTMIMYIIWILNTYALYQQNRTKNKAVSLTYGFLWHNWGRLANAGEDINSEWEVHTLSLNSGEDPCAVNLISKLWRKKNKMRLSGIFSNIILHSIYQMGWLMLVIQRVLEQISR